MPVTHAEASRILAAQDPVLAELYERHGPMTAGRRTPVADRFAVLARTIAYQQLNGRAAATIWSRVEAVLDGVVTAEAVLRSDAADLRAAGLSGSKVASLVDLAEHAADGRLALEHMGRMRDQEVIDHLVHVRGIGPWSAQMFLMHSMWRLDVWPVGDFGVRAGFARAWSLGAQPSPAQLEVLGAPFAPYRSVVAWYCWRCADDPAG